MNVQDLESFLEEHKEEIGQRLKENIINQITEKAKWELPGLCADDGKRILLKPTSSQT